MFSDLPAIKNTPIHGGRLQEAIQEGTLPAEQWLDLSTGINPHPWPAPAIQQDIIQRLPESNRALEKAAANYYFQYNLSLHDSHQVLAIPGSQWFIQHFPNIIKNISSSKPLKTLVPKFGFTEHAYWWQQHGHDLKHYADSGLDELLKSPLNADVMVLINPNNPTTKTIAPKHLLNAAINNPETVFIVDEAFVDSQQQHSLTSQSLPRNIIVLRSMGKFFGLAGLRVGFVIAHADVIQWLTPYLGPWAIANPSQWLATQALRDSDWQQSAKLELEQAARQLMESLTGFLTNHIQAIAKTDFFVTITCSNQQAATAIYESFKREGILIRMIEESPLLRIGLPRRENFQTFCDRLERINARG